MPAPTPDRRVPSVATPPSPLPSRPRVLLTGAAGMLARAVVPTLVASSWRVTCTDIDLTCRRPWGTGGPCLRHLDVRSAHDVDRAVAEVRPDLVVHLAAETSLEWCEEDPVHARRTNAEGTLNVADVCGRQGVALVYVSTAGVFRGDRPTPYSEDDGPDPINVYGWTKWVGERIVREVVPEALVLRAGWMMGAPGAKDHKFGGRMLAQLRDGRSVLHAVSDKVGTPTFAPDFADTLVELVTRGVPGGLFHCVSEGRRSRADLARDLVGALGRPDVEVRDVPSSFFADDFPAPRPRSEVLENRRLREIGVTTMRPWPEPLTGYVEPWRTVIGAATPEPATAAG